MKNRRGLSLLELSIALAVVAMLGLAIVRGGAGAIANAQIQQRDDSLKAIAQACRYYEAKFGRWPVFVTDLIDMEFINTSILQQFHLDFKPQGQLLLILDGAVVAQVATPFGGLSRLQYAKNYENKKFKNTSILAY